MAAGPAFQTVFITGGSSGIGFAVAEESVRRGMDVLLIARNEERLRAASLRLKDLFVRIGQKAEILSLDVSDAECVRRELRRSEKEFGGPDLLVTCAGDAYPNYFLDIPEEIFERTINVHIKGTWNVVRALAEGLRRRKGTLVTVSSVAGLVGVFGYTAYCAAKFGIIGLSEALRSEFLPYGVRVAVLCPPDTETPGFHTENLSKPPETRAVSEEGGVLQPAAVARALFRGLKKEQFLIVPGYSAKISVFMIRHFPTLVRSLMDRKIRSVNRQTVTHVR